MGLGDWALIETAKYGLGTAVGATVTGLGAKAWYDNASGTLDCSTSSPFDGDPWPPPPGSLFEGLSVLPPGCHKVVEFGPFDLTSAGQAAMYYGVIGGAVALLLVYAVMKFVELSG